MIRRMNLRALILKNHKIIHKGISDQEENHTDKHKEA